MIPFANAMSIAHVSASPAPTYAQAYEVLDFAGVLSGGTPRYMLNGIDVASAAAVGYSGSGTFNASGFTATGGQGIGKAQSIGASQPFIVLCEYEQPATDIVRCAYQMGGSPQGPQLYRIPDGRYGNAPGTGLPNSGLYTGASTRNVFGSSGGLSKQCFNGQPVVTGSSFVPSLSSSIIGNLYSDGSGSNSWGVPIKRFVLWRGTFTDAEIEALAGS